MVFKPQFTWDCYAQPQKRGSRRPDSNPIVPSGQVNFKNFYSKNGFKTWNCLKIVIPGWLLVLVLGILNYSNFKSHLLWKQPRIPRLAWRRCPLARSQAQISTLEHIPKYNSSWEQQLDLNVMSLSQVLQSKTPLSLTRKFRIFTRSSS